MRASQAIWVSAFGYFACYVPYSALVKAVATGHFASHSLGGFEILPISTAASTLGMFAFLGLSGWWRAASPHRIGRWTVPMPTKWTLFSGISSAAIIATTTLSYSFSGTSIVFMMLLMRGGVLIIAPLVDLIAGRHVRSMSWVALALSLGAVVFATVGRDDVRLTGVAAIDVAIYLLAYFVRLRFMSHLAKGSAEENRRYFVEEHMVSTPTIFAVVALAAATLEGAIGEQLRSGFSLLFEPLTLLVVALIGLFSEGTGIFGALILLDSRESSFCVPVNRASSILAGVLATVVLWRIGWDHAPSTADMVGATLLIAAIAGLAFKSGP